ncbi:LTA synthase family protein [Roseomonas aerophila]|uniref:LTA synthase family protein n=1 Tax=Teichococcus aerophilus TaxID=1224513 RepID=A0ABR7RHG0_9PROT|nr:LTA synthase family protein [Pseudoroseomonas aerophila]MBC9205555.1 LTA synthase family protein [Pseudoroseomonas aerophila]
MLLPYLPALLLPLLAWAAGRAVSRAYGMQGLWLDLIPVVACAAILLGLTGLPVLAGVLAAMPLAGLVLADATKRAVLDEPVVFSDAAMLPLVVRHPSLYLPFAGTHWVVGGLVAGLAVLAALWVWEPRPPLTGAVRAGLVAGGLLLIFGPLRAPPAALRRALARAPAADTARFGLLASLALYRAAARAERPGRQAAFPAYPPAFAPAGGGPAPHLILIQAESFWDPRGTLADLPANPLPHWDRLKAQSLAQGRLEVAGFGANTMRAECAALTGIGADGLGLDRFNPYFRFVVPGLRSLATTLRAAGYRALALHPFDPRFFGRHRVMPALGFQRFDSETAFDGAAKAGAHVADSAVAQRILAALAEADGPAFVFAITMQAHGPWPGADPQGQWLAHLRDADAMLGLLSGAAGQLDRPLVLCVYGDHQPALPGALQWQDRRTDWLIWRSDRRGDGVARDILAEGVFAAVSEALTGQLAPHPGKAGLQDTSEG